MGSANVVMNIIIWSYAAESREDWRRGKLGGGISADHCVEAPKNGPPGGDRTCAARGVSSSYPEMAPYDTYFAPARLHRRRAFLSRGRNILLASAEPAEQFTIEKSENFEVIIKLNI